MITMRTPIALLVVCALAVLGQPGAAWAQAASTDEARALLAERETILVQMQINDPDMVYRPGADDNASSTVESTGAERCTEANGVRTCTQGTSSSTQGGGISPSAQLRIGRATAEHARLQARLDAIDARLAQLGPAAVSSVSTELRTSTATAKGPPLAAAILVLPVLLPGLKTYSVAGRLYAGPDNAGAGGFAVHASASNLISSPRTPGGALLAYQLELGGYQGGGTEGWIGFDIGGGVRSQTAYLAIGWGLHYGGLVESRRYAPAVVYAGFRAGGVGIAAHAGAGWRYTGATGNLFENPSDPPVDQTYDLPLGFEAYHARVVVNLFSSLQVGASYQDMDGVKASSMMLGYGRAASE